MSQMTIAMIFGGTNTEHEVSILSATSVYESLSKEKYDIYPIYITKAGEWIYLAGEITSIADCIKDGYPSHSGIPAIISPDRSVGGMVVSPIDQTPYTIKIDLAFPVLHGLYGEDGTMQGLFELAGIPYIGADVLSTAICMDKEIANRLFDHAGIARAKWDVIYRRDRDRLDSYIARFEREIGYPMFTKPANAGSSVGVSKATDILSLREGIDLAFKHDYKVIVEKGIIGREVECAVLGNNHPIASVVAEIIPRNEFYDYEAKYLSPSETVLPAELDSDFADRIRAIAQKAYIVAGCSGMARVDFLIEGSSNSILLNEINTLPGFTNISMYARCMEASGVSYVQLLDKLIELALKREKRGASVDDV
ncbi:MAG: D-alanine--D-alanine ligase [Oscillospiraceae bacterium]|nr:D-alanine--D-alanine ligase [Oscillospiraceae bacterium]